MASGRCFRWSWTAGRQSFRRIGGVAGVTASALQHACDGGAQAAGAKGKRFSMKNARIMMHQPAGGAMGSADEVNIQASELNRTMKARP